MHAGWRFVCNFYGNLEDALWDDVSGRSGSWLCRHEHTIVLVTSKRVCLELFVQSGQPFFDKMDVLQEICSMTLFASFLKKLSIENTLMKIIEVKVVTIKQMLINIESSGKH